MTAELVPIVLEQLEHAMKGWSPSSSPARAPDLDGWQAMAELRHRDAARVFRALEDASGENRAFVATLYGRLGLAGEVARLLAEVGELDDSRRRFFVEAFELAGDAARADELAREPLDGRRADAALACGSIDRARDLARRFAETLRPTATAATFLYTAKVLARAGDRDRAVACARSAEQRIADRLEKGDLTFDQGEIAASVAETYAELGAAADALRVARAALHVRKAPRPWFQPWAARLALVHHACAQHAEATRIAHAHVAAIEGDAAQAFEARAALLFARIDARHDAHSLIYRPFVSPPARRRRPYDADELDELHAIYVEARLVLGEIVEAFDHLGHIADACPRARALIALARWLHAHDPPVTAPIRAAAQRLVDHRPMAVEDFCTVGGVCAR